MTISQTPSYSQKEFVSTLDTSITKDQITNKTGLVRKYIISKDIEVWDVDNDDLTFVMGSVTALLCFETIQKDGKKRRSNCGLYNWKRCKTDKI